MYKRILYELIQSTWMQPVVRTIMLNDVFRLNQLPDLEYGVICIEPLNFSVTEMDGDMFNGRFRIYYVDRLTTSKDNIIDVQSTGIDVLHNIIRQLDEDVVDVGDQEYRTFAERFKDECAGAYLEVKLGIAENYSCSPRIAGDFNLDFNEDFLITRPEQLGVAEYINGSVIVPGDFNPDYNEDYSVGTEYSVVAAGDPGNTVNADQVQRIDE